jgi:hypothetical protein
VTRGVTRDAACGRRERRCRPAQRGRGRRSAVAGDAAWSRETRRRRRAAVAGDAAIAGDALAARRGGRGRRGARLLREVMVPGKAVPRTSWMYTPAVRYLASNRDIFYLSSINFGAISSEGTTSGAFVMTNNVVFGNRYLVSKTELSSGGVLWLPHVKLEKSCKSYVTIRLRDDPIPSLAISISLSI